jgi:hypothetical protein
MSYGALVGGGRYEGLPSAPQRHCTVFDVPQLEQARTPRSGNPMLSVGDEVGEPGDGQEWTGTDDVGERGRIGVQHPRGAEVGEEGKRVSGLVQGDEDRLCAEERR